MKELTRVRLIALVFGLFLLNGALLTAYYYLKTKLYHTNGNLSAIAINEMGGSVSGACLMLFFFALISNYERIGPRTWKDWTLIHTGAIVLYSVLHTSSHLVMRAVLYPAFGLGEYNPGHLALRFAMEFPNDVLTYAKWLIAFLAFEYYRRLRDREHSLTEARLKNLQAQMQPHFLMNSLNAISSLIYSNPQAADEMIARLGAFLRRLLVDEQGQRVPLSHEIESVQAYISIMQMRYEDRLRYRFDIHPSVSTAQVPPLILQPLVENSILHGSNPTDFSVDIDVSAKPCGDRVEIAVRDRGSGVKPNARSGVGLQNLRSRLATLYGDRQNMYVEPADGGGTVVRLMIPQNV